MASLPPADQSSDSSAQPAATESGLYKAMPHLVRAAVLWGALCTLPVAGLAQSPKAPPLTGCTSESPPFLLMKNGVGVSGFSFEVFQNIAQQLGRSPEVSELPWARCLHEVKAGRIDVAIDAYDDAERRKSFHYTHAYYTLTPQIFYIGSAAKHALPVSTAQELARLKGCGVHEYTYEHYDLDASKLDLGANSDLQMLKKLKLGRCDYAVEELEYVIGGRNHDPTWLDETGIASFRPAWARAPSVHLLVGKSRPDGDDLVSRLNAAIEKGATSGLFKTLQARYFQSRSKSVR